MFYSNMTDRPASWRMPHPKADGEACARGWAPARSRRPTLAPVIRCRTNYGMRCWPTRAPLRSQRRSSNAGSRTFSAMCCASNASAVPGSSKFRRPTQSASMGSERFGRMSGSGCSTRPAPIEPAGSRKMDAGPIGLAKAARLQSEVAKAE